MLAPIDDSQNRFDVWLQFLHVVLNPADLIIEVLDRLLEIVVGVLDPIPSVLQVALELHLLESQALDSQEHPDRAWDN